MVVHGYNSSRMDGCEKSVPGGIAVLTSLFLVDYLGKKAICASCRLNINPLQPIRKRLWIMMPSGLTRYEEARSAPVVVADSQRARENKPSHGEASDTRPSTSDMPRTGASSGVWSPPKRRSLPDTPELYLSLPVSVQRQCMEHLRSGLPRNHPGTRGTRRARHPS